MKMNLRNILKNKYLYPCLHVLLSFFFERRLLIFSLDKDIIATVAMNQAISDFGERVLGYLCAKIISIIMIFFLWNLGFFVAKNIKEKAYVKWLLGIGVAGTVLLIMIWPYTLLASMDNLITYSYALRFFPEYWHSAYTSIVYTAILMVVPYSWFLGVFQWIFSLFVFGYMFKRVDESTVLNRKLKWVSLLVLLLPGTYTLFTNAYRTELYALLCMFAVSMTAVDVIEKKQRSLMEAIVMAVLCGLIAVWRSEGIILGILLYLVNLIFVYRFNLKKSVLCFVCVMVSFVLISMPQKLGDKKYYGKDYSFINSFPTLQNVLNADSANLSYEGANEDLESLAAVTPIEILRAYGMDGYRRYNYANGRGDINQSLASPEVGAAYMSAYYRIILHNIPIYVRTQVTMLAKALMIIDYPYIEPCKVAPVNDLPPWDLNAWTLGFEDLVATSAIDPEGGFNTVVYLPLEEKINAVAGFAEKIYFYQILLVLVPLFEIYMFFREGILLLKKKENAFGLSMIAFTLLGQAAAIALVMPAAALVYLHAFYYCSACLVTIYLQFRFSVRKRKANE